MIGWRTVTATLGALSLIGSLLVLQPVQATAAPDAPTLLLAQGKAKKLLPLQKASKKEPKGLERALKGGDPAKAKRKVKASRKARLDKCKRIPACKEKLDVAMKARGRKSMLSPAGKTSFAALLNPLHIGTAEAAISTLTLKPCPAYSRATGIFYGSMTQYGGLHKNCTHTLFRHYRTNADSGRTGGAPFAHFKLYVPSTGYYLINVDAYVYPKGLRTNLKSYSGGRLSTWVDASYGRHDHPDVVYLAAGRHYLYFYPTASTSYGYASVYDMTIDPLSYRSAY